MDQEAIKPILDELFSSLEPLEAQNSALLQLLKAKGMVTDQELAPFRERAANTASVRWRAVRVRTAALLANLLNPPEEGSSTAPAEEESHPAAEKNQPEERRENSNEIQAHEKGESEPKSAAAKTGQVGNERKASRDGDVENAA